VSPSEDREKVLTAARNVLGDCSYQVEERDDAVVLRSSEPSCLQKIHDQFRDRHVRNAARRLLLKSIDGSRMRILFNRQAAFVGVVAAVSTGEESPVGPLVLELECEKPEELLDWLTPYRAAEPQGQVHL
jgi:predicted RNA binding protein with dsRBD fold (UPF0201 family)